MTAEYRSRLLVRYDRIARCDEGRRWHLAERALIKEIPRLDAVIAQTSQNLQFGFHRIVPGNRPAGLYDCSSSA